MAISFVAQGSGGDAGSTSLNAPPMPTGRAADDLLLTPVTNKPYSVTPTTATSGWSQTGTGTNGTTASGTDTGSTRSTVFQKIATGGADAGPTFTLTGGNTAVSKCYAFRKDAGDAWEIEYTSGGDATETGTTFSATGDNTLNITTGDWIAWAVSHPSDAIGGASQTVSVPGCTGTTTLLGNTPTTSVGDDCAMYLGYWVCDSGTASGPPTFTMSTTSGKSGGTVSFVRLRAAPLTPAESFHGHTSESPALTQVHELAPADSFHAHTSEEGTISMAGDLPADGTLNSHTSESPALTQVHMLAPADTANSHASESPVLIENSSVTITWLWTGAQTDEGFTVSAKVGTAGLSCRLAAQEGTLSALDSPVFGSTVLSDANGYVKATITGLDAGTDYTHTLEIDGGLGTTLGHASTLPVAGEPFSFRWAHASCKDSGSNHRVFDSIRLKNPLLFQQLGDLHYADYNGTNQTTRRGHYDTVFAQSRVKALIEAVPVDHVWDDHDFCGNNSNGSAAGKATAQVVNRQIEPHHTYPDANAIYHSYQVGRVGFIVTDLRSERSTNSATDDASKYMMSATQETWWQDTMLELSETCALIVWVSSNVYNGLGTTGVWFDNDQWSAFTTQRTRLADFLADNGLGEKVFVVTGDAHMLAHDDGSNSDFATGGGAPLPQFCGSAMDNTSIVRGDNWSSGTFGGGGQYGLFEFTDDGEVLTWEWSGIKVNASTGAESILIGVAGSFGESEEEPPGGAAHADARIVIPGQASTLTDFVSKVDLADMPSGWWADTTSDLGNVRVKYDGDVIPFDIVAYDKDAETGVLFFKHTLTTSPTEFLIEAVPGETALATSDPNGRDAVWSAFEAVIDPWDETLTDRTGNNGVATLTGGTISGGKLTCTGTAGEGFYIDTSAAPGSVWCYSAVADRVDPNQRNVLDLSSAAGSNRALMGMRGSGGNNYQLWDSDNDWLSSGDDETGPCRLFGTHNGTTNRKIYTDGVLRNTDTSITARNEVRLFVGRRFDGDNTWLGTVSGPIYKKHTIPSDDYIAAEHASWDSPSSFYTVTEVQTAEVARAEETDEAMALAPLLRNNIALGQATEEDTTQPFSLTARLVRATETDSAGTVVRPNVTNIGRAEDTSEAGAFTVIRPFLTPFAYESVEHHFWGRYKIRVGVTLIKRNGHYEEVQYPWLGELDGLVDGRDYFLGGHQYYDLPQEVIDDLIADGYDAGPGSETGFGEGGFGEGGFGG